jgi:1-deoxy-D-xylulose-5-phosphate synthase
LISLEDINGPEDLRERSVRELEDLAADIRDVIISGVSETGGHLAPSLGVVELTIALHYVLDTPRDKIIWDVGHQCYPHKLLTGRYRNFHTLRKYKGIGGFPRRLESEYDSFDTGHSSTSISAAIGMVEGRDVMGEDFKVVAVIGDGAMTAGLAFEGLNHAGQLKKDLIVVLNDNEMSISENVGALSKYLNRILTGDVFRKFKKETKGILENIPKVGGQMARFAEKAEESLKGLFLPGILFEELGFNYIGPIDGHNLEQVIDTLKKAKTLEGPVLIHAITKKGKGYEYSEDDPTRFHGVGPFEVETGKAPGGKSGGSLAYSDVFGMELAELADGDPSIVAITAAMKEGTGLSHFAARHPNRLYDVGIAEPHAVTFAAGMATRGARPVVAIYSTFLQRSYDEIIHDVCLQNLPVVFALDRAGIVGEDGPTHQGLFDISFLRHVPNLTVMAPKDAGELRAMLAMALKAGGPVAIRYPRGKAVEINPTVDLKPAKAELLREGKALAILAIGNTVAPVFEAAGLLESSGMHITVANMRFIKPMDLEMIGRLAQTHEALMTVEENILQGGFGSAVNEHLNSIGSKVRLDCLAIPDEFVEQGTQAELRKLYGLDARGIAGRALKVIKG